MKREIQDRKRRHRVEELETIFDENKIAFNPDDNRLDSISDVSSSDDDIEVTK